MSSGRTALVTTALIPAAGRSARLGQPKQLVRLRGETLIARAVRVAREAGCARIIVVEGAVPLAEAVASLHVELVPCADWERGPGASLRAGAKAAGDDAVLVLLADQWRVTGAHLRALLDAPGSVAAAFYAGALGVPARFDPASAQVLGALSDDQGAKAWLRREAFRVTPVPMPEAEVDLDTAAQLADLQCSSEEPQT